MQRLEDVEDMRPDAWYTQPDMLATVNNLVQCYQKAGRHADAIRLCEDVSARLTRALGPDHPPHPGGAAQPGYGLPHRRAV
jgi:hypothetical protein